MEEHVLESQYPITFRKEDAKNLGEHLKDRQSVVLVGSKRVGISSFLRFFFYKKEVSNAYIHDKQKHLFIPVDLNDLVEREIFPFWTLVLKRIEDAVVNSNIPKHVKKKIEQLFVDSIQSQDLFFRIDSVRKSLIAISESGFLPTIVFIRFDRMKEAATSQFLDNLRGLLEATRKKLCYVFTANRTLDQLSPSVFTKTLLASFVHMIYIKPASKEEAKVVLKIYKNQYSVELSTEEEDIVLELTNGYMEYLYLCLIFLKENRDALGNPKQLLERFTHNERINLQSEEIWESLTKIEQEVLLKISQNKDVLAFQQEAQYVWKTGIVSSSNTFFNPLFQAYVARRGEDNAVVLTRTEFTKKENLLFLFLKNHQDEICERDQIIEAIWPEEEDLGVSDWAIDRLIARVRSKLKLQKSKFEIQTVKTRGYKLVSGN